MNDVAMRAGVSQSTVSYALSGARPISDDVRARIDAAIRELDYAPRAAAQALRAGRSGILALSILDHEASRHSWVGFYLMQLTLSARRRGYDLLVSVESSGSADAVRELARAQRADGIVLMSVIRSDPRIPAVEQMQFPAVALGEPTEGALAFVDYDFRRAAVIALTHLKNSGHTRVLHLGPRAVEVESGQLYVDRIIRGFREAADTLDLALTEYHPVDDQTTDRSALAELIENTGVTGLAFSSRLDRLEGLPGQFCSILGADPRSDVIEFGSSGLEGDDASPFPRIVNPIDTIAAASIDALVNQLEGNGAVSHLVAPQLVSPSQTTRP
ncbi:LacI family DNA-binding transcriptional regulator [Microbacterium karelineae]|uniref:LacI family DNA-binding transcriptional regulator n=1 Tax=Microbacterium karelineae TaxID=2654283 RepID=UPI0012EACAF0|nr:LacI family DNA-binding transcriptional regulator [Microbacterium karelineae]